MKAERASKLFLCCASVFSLNYVSAANEPMVINGAKHGSHFSASKTHADGYVLQAGMFGNENAKVSAHQTAAMHRAPRINYLTGPYIGGSIGPQLNITGAPTAYDGMEFTGSAGLGTLFRSFFYLGGEFFVGTSAKIKDYPISGTNNGVRSTLSVGGDFIPGVMLTDTLLGYLRVGGLRAKFNDVNAASSAWQVGLGGESHIYRNLDLRAEYVFSLYNRIPTIGRPQINQFNFGIVYKIG